MSENAKPKVVIAGGSGFLGMNLARYLTEREYQVVILSRNSPRQSGAWNFSAWDGRSLDNWVSQLEGATAIVNLAGRTVDCIKTPDQCDEILRSRVEATRVLGKAIRTLKTPPPIWVQMATAHRYGDPPEVICDEDSAFGYGLAPTVGQAWEEEYEAALLPEMRGVALRTSFVIGRSGGALARLALLVRFGLGGTVGSGKQGMSWIHEEDMNRLFERAITDQKMSGAYIATAPNPVSNAEFMRELRKALKMPIGLPAYSWMVRIGAPLIMRTDPELGLYGRYCIPKRLTEEGFEFNYSHLREALANIYPS